MYVINVSGNMCSGKTTLANLISERLDFDLIRTSVDEKLLLSFFNDVGQCFLQEQLTIFLNKLMEYQTAVSNKRNVVFDRSLYEDVFVFAQYFISNRDKFGISDEDVGVYQNITKKFLQNIPQSDLTIFCYAPHELCQKRMTARKIRSYEQIYPQNHLSEIEKQYEKTISQIDSIYKYLIDTTIFDITDKKIQELVIEDIKQIMFDKITRLSVLKKFSSWS